MLPFFQLQNSGEEDAASPPWQRLLRGLKRRLPLVGGGADVHMRKRARFDDDEVASLLSSGGEDASMLGGEGLPIMDRVSAQEGSLVALESAHKGVLLRLEALERAQEALERAQKEQSRDVQAGMEMVRTDVRGLQRDVANLAAAQNHFVSETLPKLATRDAPPPPPQASRSL